MSHFYVNQNNCPRFKQRKLVEPIKVNKIYTRG